MSILGCLLFFRFYLIQTSNQFTEDFSKQNLDVLASSDIYPLASRLSALSSSVHWICITASRQGKIFYERKKSDDCQAKYFQTQSEVRGRGDDQLSIRFTLTLPRSLKWAGLGFSGLQLLLLWFLFLSAKKSTERSEREKVKHQLHVAAIAAQVAHDVRSPLAALNMITQDLSQIPEEKRIIMRSAVSRINDIANNLLQKNHSKVEVPDSQEGINEQLVSSLIDNLISEKRFQFRSKLGVEIEFYPNTSSYGLFAKIQPTEFKRVLSNLINNAVEAMTDPGRVCINLAAKEGQIEICISDNGKGIPSEILQKLGQKGVTHGKSGGSGLELFHARTSIESWGGKFKIESVIRSGTKLTLTLPQSASPSWFVKELVLFESSQVIVLDDDSSIHQVWDGRFQSAKISEKNIEVFHFSAPEEISSWVQKCDKKLTQIYLMDYELLGQSTNGLEIIERLGIASQAILITSRYEETHIRKKCTHLKIPLIPKVMVGFVPIVFQKPLKLYDAVLIDDDSLVAVTWQMVADKKSKNIITFQEPVDFFSHSVRIDRRSPIYVDSSLGNGIKGEQVAKQIYELGFQWVYLATGYQVDQFPPMPWLKGIIGKEFPL